MTADRDTARTVRSWLRTDEHESADRVLETVLARLDTIPQRRPLWPRRRFTQMNASIRIAVATAAVLVVAILGYNLLPGRGGIGGPPTPSPAVTPSATPGLQTVPPPSEGVTIGDPFELPVTVTLPTDWVPITRAAGQFDFSPPEESYPYLGFFLVDGVYRDPCHPEDGLQPSTLLGPTAPDEIMQWFELFPAPFEVLERSSSIVSDRMVEHLVLTNSIDTTTADCSGGQLLRLFVARGEDVSTNGGTRQEAWAFWEVETRHLLVVAELGPDPAPGDQELIEAIVASVDAPR